MLDKTFILFSFEKFEEPAAALDKLKDLEKARLIPLSSQIDAGCGFALRILERDLPLALNRLTKKDYDGIFLMKRDKNGRMLIEKYVF